MHEDMTLRVATGMVALLIVGNSVGALLGLSSGTLSLAMPYPFDLIWFLSVNLGALLMLAGIIYPRRLLLLDLTGSVLVAFQLAAYGVAALSIDLAGQWSRFCFLVGLSVMLLGRTLALMPKRVKGTEPIYE